MRYLVLAQEVGGPPSGGGETSAGTGQAPAGGQPGSPPPKGVGYEQFLFIGIMILVFYFLLIRPQQKRAKKHKTMVNSLKRGDNVITSSGIYGRITDIDGPTVTLEIAKNTRVKVLKGYVGGISTPETEEELAQGAGNR